MALLADFLSAGSWIAAGFLSVGYWLQVYRIHVHKEVRDLSAPSYVLFTFAYLLLGIEGYKINSMVFLVKNILVIIPTITIVFQIYYHQNDTWE